MRVLVLVFVHPGHSPCAPPQRSHAWPPPSQAWCLHPYRGLTPRLTRRGGPPCIAGVMLNMAALVLFGVSSSTGFNAFIPGAILLGLGNITFHLAQFHVSALFPRSRGLVASIFVAGFTGCGIVMYLLMQIFESAGGSRCALRAAIARGHGPIILLCRSAASIHGVLPCSQGCVSHNHAQLCRHLLSVDTTAGLDDAQPLLSGRHGLFAAPRLDV